MFEHPAGMVVVKAPIWSVTGAVTGLIEGAVWNAAELDHELSVEGDEWGGRGRVDHRYVVGVRTNVSFGWSFALKGAVTLSKKERENSASRTFSSDRDCRTPHVHS